MVRSSVLALTSAEEAVSKAGQQALSLAKEAVSKAGTQALHTVIFFAVVCTLAAVSVIIYVRSVLTEPESSEDPPVSPEDRARASKTDDQLGLSSPQAGRPTRGGLLRRHTVTVAELPRRHWTIDSANETMSSFMFVVNMFADLGPPGFLPVAFGMKETGFIPGAIMLVVFYCLCVYTMYVISKSMQITGGKDFAGQWSRVVGEGSSWVPVLVVVLVTLGCTLSYACFYADIFTGVMPWLGLNMSRSFCLLGFTIFPTMPLCLLKNLSALAYSSSFALVAVLYTAVVMVVRSMDGTYIKGGHYYASVPLDLAPKVPKDHLYAFGLPSLVLLNALAVAFLSHYNGCKYYRELADHTPAKLVKCTATAMGICTVMFAVTGFAAFQTFGTNADGVILKNYSREDVAANVARLGVGLSIIASYPLMFSGLREATITLLKLAMPSQTLEFDLVWRQDIISMVLLCLVTGIALVVTDAGLVVGVVGAICGSACIYIVPCTLYAGAIRGYLSKDKSSGELAFLRFLTCLGAILGVAGCYSSLAF